MKNAIRERKSKVLGLFLCFLLLGIDYSFASYNNYSQFKTLSVSMSNSTLREVLKTIEKSSQFVFFYLDDAVNLERKVSIDSKIINKEAKLNKVELKKTYLYDLETKAGEEYIFLVSDDSCIDCKDEK